MGGCFCIYEFTFKQEQGVIFRMNLLFPIESVIMNQSIRILEGTMVVLNSIFQDGMILQADKPIRLFGQGVGKVAATCGRHTVTAEAKEGRFVLTLPSRNYGDVIDITVSDEESSVVLRQALVGDVYIFSGQSNMEYPLKDTIPDGEIMESDDVRVFSSETVFHNGRFSPSDGWKRMTKDVAPYISAIAYFTARDLYRKKKRPVGIITAHQGASIIESWLSSQALTELDLHLPDSELFYDHFAEEYSAFNHESFLYDLCILPLVPLSLSGVVWYQGESNCGGEARVYDKFLTKLITSWRQAFDDTQLPFVIVQIADYEGRDFEDWHTIQSKQKQVCDTVPYCFLAVSRDVSETDNIHPPTKHILSYRIAQLL